MRIVPGPQNIAFGAFDGDAVRLIEAAFSGIGKTGESHRLSARGSFRGHFPEAAGLADTGKERAIDRKLERKSLQLIPAGEAAGGFDRIIEEGHASIIPS